MGMPMPTVEIKDHHSEINSIVVYIINNPSETNSFEMLRVLVYHKDVQNIKCVINSVTCLEYEMLRLSKQNI